jgi:hypothetical protein
VILLSQGTMQVGYAAARFRQEHGMMEMGPWWFGLVFGAIVMVGAIAWQVRLWRKDPS